MVYYRLEGTIISHHTVIFQISVFSRIQEDIPLECFTQ